MNKLATAIVIRHHAYVNDRDKGRQETYFTDTFQVGKMHAVPDGPELDEVVEIRVSDVWRPHVEVEFKEWGEMFLTDYVTQIFFKNEQYTKVLRIKKDARAAEDTESESPSLSKDLL